MFITTSRVCLNQQTRQIDFAFLKNEPVLAFNVKNIMMKNIVLSL